MKTPNTPPAYSATTPAGTFKAWRTGHEDVIDEGAGESWTLHTWLMLRPDGSTAGYFTPNTTHAGRRGFFDRVY